MKSLTIFYADDDQDDREYFESVIGSLSDEVELHIHDGGDSLIHALNNPPPQPHVLFLDLNMPGRNGFEVLEYIRSSKNHQCLPIVIFSTSTDEKLIEKTRAMGASYYLPKSNNYTSLKKSLEHILKMDWENFQPGSDNFLYRNN